MNSNKNHARIAHGLFWLVGIICLLVVSPASAISICASNLALLKGALSLGTLQSSAYTIQIVQGSYLMDADVETYFSAPTTIEGGYSANCATRTVNAGNTTINAQGHFFHLYQHLASPQALLNIDGLTLSNATGIQFTAGDYGSFSNDEGSLHVSNVRFTQVAEGIAFSVFNGEATFENILIDHVFGTGSSAVSLFMEGSAAVMINHMTADLPSGTDFKFHDNGQATSFSVYNSILWNSS
ncbi:MAG: hypothetical protein ABI451_12060, partial [Dokdonella sp.]